MTKLVVFLVALAGVLAFAPTAHAQSYSSQIYSAAAGPGKCLGVKENNLSHPFMAKCAGYAAENWAVSLPNAYGFVRFQSQRTGSGFCLGVAAADTSTVKIASCASVTNQQWMLTPAGQPGTYTITSQLLGPGVCLGILPYSNNTELDMNSCHDYPGQIWTIQN